MALNQTLHDCIEGRISPEVAVARFLFTGARAGEIEREIAACAPHARLDQVRTLLLGREQEIDQLAAQVTSTWAEHSARGATPTEGIARIAAFFDRAVEASAEASVALYSLGDPAILQAATAEILEWLETEDLLRAEGDVLDLGCGFGRVSAALSPRCRSVLGLDVSPGMIAEARSRFGHLPNVYFERTAGEDLAVLGHAVFDLVLAIDSFPYLVQAGETVVAQHLDDAYRVLKPTGALVVLNLSYEGEAFDEAHAAPWAEAHGFRLTHADRQPFRLWDGSAYVFAR